MGHSYFDHFPYVKFMRVETMCF